MLAKNIKNIKTMKTQVKQMLEQCPTEYLVGYYNGIESSLAVLEGREAEFLAVEIENKKEEEEKEEQNNVGRTLYSGIRRRSKK